MLARSIKVILVLLPHLVALLRDKKRFILFGKPREVSDAVHGKRASQLRETISSLGPTFIKLTQILSSRADILPPYYLTELSKLQDQVPPISSKEVISVIEKELNNKTSEIFDRFDSEAIAAASLGQVHRACYKGEEVIVKVLKPGVPELVEMDLSIMMWLTDVFNFLYSSHEAEILSTIVNEFSKIIREEMDFRKEAENISTFRENFTNHDDIIIPDDFPELTTRRVLVLKYYKGLKIDDVDGLKKMGINVNDLIKKLVLLYSRQVLVDGIFHADPHPGNILVNEEGKIILLDFGMVVLIDDETKRELVNVAISGAKRDYDGLVDGLIKLNIIGPEINISVMKDAISVMTDIFDKKKVNKKRIKEITNEIFNTFYQFPLNLPSNLVYLFKSAVMIEGIGMKFDPSFNGIKDGTPIVKDMFKESMGTPSTDIIDFLFQKGKNLYKMSENLESVLRKAERELFRVRLHPVDIMRLEGYLGYMLRRVLVGLSSLTNAVIGSMVYIKSGSLVVLFLFLAFSVFLMVLTFMLPARRLFDYRTRHVKRVEKDIDKHLTFE